MVTKGTAELGEACDPVGAGEAELREVNSEQN